MEATIVEGRGLFQSSRRREGEGRRGEVPSGRDLAGPSAAGAGIGECFVATEEGTAEKSAHVETLACPKTVPRAVGGMMQPSGRRVK